MPVAVLFLPNSALKLICDKIMLEIVCLISAEKIIKYMILQNQTSETKKKHFTFFSPKIRNFIFN